MRMGVNGNGKGGQSGATVVEYAFLVSLIAVLVIVVVAAVGQNVRSKFQLLESEIARMQQGS